MHVHVRVMYTIRQAELRLLHVTMERSVYQGVLEKAKASVVPYITKDGTFIPPPQRPHRLDLPTTGSTWRSRCFTPSSLAPCTS